MVGALDFLAVTCLDRLAGLPEVQVCGQYVDGGQCVHRIAPPASPGDLAQQAALTARLQRARPRLTPSTDPAALIARIEAQIKLPVGLLSTGASACDKAAITLKIRHDMTDFQGDRRLLLVVSSVWRTLCTTPLTFRRYLANPCVLHVALGYGTLWPDEGKHRYLCNPDAHWRSAMTLTITLTSEIEDELLQEAWAARHLPRTILYPGNRAAPKRNPPPK